MSNMQIMQICAICAIFFTKVATAADAIPPLLTQKAMVIGSAISTPLDIGTLATSSVGGNGLFSKQVVMVPIVLPTGAIEKLLQTVETGEEVVQFNLEHGGEILKDGLIKVGQVILKPIAVVVGAQTALTGAGLGIAGTGIKGVGVGVEAVGAKMLATGLAAKGLGGRLIQKQFPPYLK